MYKLVTFNSLIHVVFIVRQYKKYFTCDSINLGFFQHFSLAGHSLSSTRSGSSESFLPPFSYLSYNSSTLTSSAALLQEKSSDELYFSRTCRNKNRSDHGECVSGYWWFSEEKKYNKKNIINNKSGLSAGCKESQFYSLPFGWAIASMYRSPKVIST